MTLYELCSKKPTIGEMMNYRLGFGTGLLVGLIAVIFVLLYHGMRDARLFRESAEYHREWQGCEVRLGDIEKRYYLRAK